MHSKILYLPVANIFAFIAMAARNGRSRNCWTFECWNSGISTNEILIHIKRIYETFFGFYEALHTGKWKTRENYRFIFALHGLNTLNRRRPHQVVWVIYNYSDMEIVILFTFFKISVCAEDLFCTPL